MGIPPMPNQQEEHTRRQQEEALNQHWQDKPKGLLLRCSFGLLMVAIGAAWPQLQLLLVGGSRGWGDWLGSGGGGLLFGAVLVCAVWLSARFW
jgi:hypothetical protein